MHIGKLYNFKLTVFIKLQSSVLGMKYYMIHAQQKEKEQKTFHRELKLSYE